MGSLQVGSGWLVISECRLSGHDLELRNMQVVLTTTGSPYRPRFAIMHKVMYEGVHL